MLFRRVLSWLAWLTGGVIALVLVALVVLWLRPVKLRPASTETVEGSPERVAQGRYLFHHVANCAHCHSEHDDSRYAWPVVASRIGAGSCVPREPGGPEECMPNITPHDTAGIGAWTDGELLRAIREGVDRHGRALGGMPYDLFRSLSDEDARAIVAYMRTLEPLDTARPRSGFPFPLNLVVKLFPEPLDGPVPARAADGSLARGEYLATVAQCGQCHGGLKGEPFAGGEPIWSPFGEVVAANLTPDPATGLGGWSREMFIARFQSVGDMGDDAPAGPGDSAMPWSSYSGMSEDDLGALFTYLQSLPAVVSKTR